jgi:hypothetical protein
MSKCSKARTYSIVRAAGHGVARQGEASFGTPCRGCLATPDVTR